MKGNEKQKILAVIGVAMILAVAVTVFGGEGPSQDVEAFTFGNEAVYSMVHGESQYLRGNRFTAPQTGTIKELYIYISSESVNTRHVQMAVYSDNTGVVGSLLYQTESKAISAGSEGWRQYTVTSTVQVTLGEDYWLIYNSDCPNMKFRYTQPACEGRLVRYSIGSYGSFPSTFAADSYGDACLSMYANCTEVTP